jgi:hypothetical protein
MDEYENQEMEARNAADPDVPDEFDQTPIEEDTFDIQARANETALADARREASAAQANAEHERQTRREAERVLSELRQELAEATTILDQERQARLKAEKERAEAQAALEEAGRSVPVQVVNEEAVSQEYSSEGIEHRLTFIVRLMLDERGEPRRTEIEDMKKIRKESFHALNGDQLAAFMRSFLQPVAVATTERPREIPVPEAAGEIYTMKIIEPQILDRESGDAIPLSVRAGEAFTTQAKFHIQPTEDSPGEIHGSDYEISVYANEIGGNHSQLVASSYGRLQENTLDYTARMEAPGLSPGVYRLVTLVTLHTPTSTTGHYEGPIFLVD